MVSQSRSKVKKKDNRDHLGLADDGRNLRNLRQSELSKNLAGKGRSDKFKSETNYRSDKGKAEATYTWDGKTPISEVRKEWDNSQAANEAKTGGYKK